MNIGFEITDDLANDVEKDRLKRLLKAEDEEQLELLLNKVVKASFLEYKEMLLGKGLPTRADEIKQHRLLHLIKKYFEGEIPTEAEVSSLFQLTENESKSLIRNVRTRFKFELEDEINTTLKNAIGNFELIEDTETYEGIIHSANVHDELNLLISELNPMLEPIKKDRNSSKKYSMRIDTYNLLSGYFGL